MSNDSSRKKKILFLAGSTYIILIGGLLVMISLVLAIILLGYLFSESEPVAERVVRQRPALVAFDDLAATPVTNATATSSQTVQPAVDTSSNIDVAESVSENPTNNSSGLSVEVMANTQTDSPTQTSTSATPSPISGSASNLPTPSPTRTAEVTLVSSVTLTPTPTPTSTPTPTPSFTPTDLPTATPMFTNTPSPTPVPGSISGRVLLNAVPVGGVTIMLEDQALNPIAETIVGSDGIYEFPNLPATNEGYNLVFAQEWNTQYQLEQVISWGWLGPIHVADGSVVQIPDLDISLLGFEPTVPAPNASFSIASLSSSNPIQFEWVAYPEATKYWVDLAHGQDQNIVWQSSIASSTSVSFDGTLSSGSQIQPGEYWWGVGARRDLGTYKLTVYGYLPVLLIVP